MTSETWAGFTGRNFPIQVVKSTCNPMLGGVSNNLCPKEAPFMFFSHLLIMERLQNWHDLMSHISNFGDEHFIYSVVDIKRWKFQGDQSAGVAMAGIQTFSEMRSLDVTWWLDLGWPGFKIFTIRAKKMYEQVYKNQRRSTLLFLTYPRKTSGEGCPVSKHPRPGPS